MSSHEMSYLEQRAESQLELARRATHPAAVRAHYQLAEMYLDKLYGKATGAVARTRRS
jgi:HEPN domain-containing protein